MLDPKGRKSIFETILNLKKAGTLSTIIMVTHDMDEAARAEKIIIMHEGEVIKIGTPEEIFSDYDLIDKSGLTLPTAAAIARKYDLPKSLDAKQVAKNLKEKYPNKKFSMIKPRENKSGETILEARNISYVYGAKTPSEVRALKDVSLEIKKGEIVSIIGATGSGKSTLARVLCALEKSFAGDVLICGENIKKMDRLGICSKITLAFQYPENQIFEETIYKEIAFGPENLGADDVDARVLESAEIMKTSNLAKSPHFLSGGQKRRVALASCLAMRPEILVLDEATAGLDPKARASLLTLIDKLNRESNMTIVFISHSMDDIAKISDRVLVFWEGELCLSGTPEEIFAKKEELTALNLALPKEEEVYRLC
jgi:energy-coupling factor transport system ATP-binding protein